MPVTQSLSTALYSVQYSLSNDTFLEFVGVGDLELHFQEDDEVFVGVSLNLVNFASRFCSKMIFPREAVFTR